MTSEQAGPSSQVTTGNKRPTRLVDKSRSPEPIDLLSSEEEEEEQDSLIPPAKGEKSPSPIPVKKRKETGSLSDSSASLEEILNSLSEKGEGSSKKNEGDLSIGKSNFFSAKKENPVIRTGLPMEDDPMLSQRIYKTVSGHFKENANMAHIIFSSQPNVKACFPVCSLSMRPDQISLGNVDAASERKCISMQLPSFVERDAKPVFFFYKQAFLKTHVLKISEEALTRLVKSGRELIKFLREIDGKQINSTEGGLPSLPPPVILEESQDKKQRAILQIDEIDLKRQSLRISPTVSIRLNRASYDRSRWFPDKAGVTLSPVNFFFLIEATIVVYLKEVKLMYETFRAIYFENEQKFKELANPTEEGIEDE